MAIALKKQVELRDWEKTGHHVGLAVMEAAMLNAPNVLSNLRSAMGEESLAKQTLEERAYTWVWTSIAGAVHTVMKDERVKKQLNVDDTIPALKEFEAEVMPQDGEETIDRSAIYNPLLITAAGRAADEVTDFLHRVAPNNGIEEAHAANLFRTAFYDEAGHIFTHETDFYAPITAALTGPAAAGRELELAWTRHAKWIRGLWERDPIFGQEPESGLSLSKVYEHLRCFWHVVDEVDTEHERNEPAKKRTAYLGDLHETMHAWLNSDADRDRLRLVTGGPGCGKSSFARAFAVEVGDAQTHRVIFIPLQTMALGGDLVESIGQFLKRRWHATRPDGGAGFQVNPLEAMGEETLPLLLVFDGLDELTPSKDKAQELTRKFVSAICGFLKTSPTARAVVLGRPAAVQEAIDEVQFDVPHGALLHVSKLTPLDADDLGHADEIVADETVLGEDQRQRFWQRWTALSGGDTATIPPAVTDQAMGELNAEPLLLYLLILSGYTGDRWEEARGNRNVVYREIFAEIYKRSKDKNDGSLKGIEPKDFFGLMECLGLAAWHGNGRTGTDEEFGALRDLHLRHRKKHLKDVEAATLRGAAVNFYTRKDLSGEAGFEFIHKSFGEYLTARGLLNFAFRLVTAMTRDEEPIDAPEAGLRWTSLIREAELSEQIIRFACDEARLVYDLKPRMVSDTKDALVTLFNWTLRHGIPTHREAGAAMSYRRVETRQRCAEVSLLLVLSALARTLPNGKDGSHLLAFDWPPASDPFHTLTRLQTNRDPVARLLLVRLGMPNADLSGANLELVDLSEADLRGADLRGADLREADLYGADLELADCNRLRIDSARLQSASLKGARNLTQAQIDSAEGSLKTVLPDRLVRPAHWED